MASSPFNPGAANPRYLAGRKQEEAALADLLDIGAQGPVGVIFAPRGNGKTALAHWLERAADARGIDVRYRYARSCSTLEGASALLLDEKLDSHQEFESAVAGYGGPSRLLVVDEAQGLTPPIVSSLVTAAELSQGVLSVVFVGTPHLHQMLHDIDPSLWAKGPVLPLHPLDEASAADALQTPATAAGRPIEASVLEDVVADCHGYPPFLQAWGANLWRQSQANAPIDDAACVRARPIVDFYRFSFYEHRKEELAPYAASALEVAHLFADAAIVHETSIYDAIRRGLPARSVVEDLADAFAAFRDLGLFWREPGAMDFYRPAIPSLMDSIREGQDAAVMKAARR